MPVEGKRGVDRDLGDQNIKNSRSNMPIPTYPVKYSADIDITLETLANQERYDLANWIIDAIHNDPTTDLVIDFINVPIHLTSVLGDLLLADLDPLVRKLQAERKIAMPANIRNIWDHISLEPITHLPIWGLLDRHKRSMPSISFITLD